MEKKKIKCKETVLFVKKKQKNSHIIRFSACVYDSFRKGKMCYLLLFNKKKTKKINNNENPVMKSI
jgi:hypothetical protein